MNGLQITVDIVMALIIVLMIALGIKRGLVKSFFKSTKLIFVILVTLLIGSLIVSLCQSLFVNSWFEGTISERFVEKQMQTSNVVDFDDLQGEIPAIYKNLLPMEELEKDFDSLSGNTFDAAKTIGEKMEDMLSTVVSNVIGYVIAFIISFIFCTIAIIIIDKIFTLPVLDWLNRVGGVFWGLANAYLTTSVLVCIVALIFGNDFVNGTIITKAIHYIGLFTF